MLLLAMLLAGQAPAAPACDKASLDAAVKTAATALEHKDLAGARATMNPFLLCPVDSGQAYIAHVLAADIAAREGNWQPVRALLATAGIHSEVTLGARVQLLRMRADQGLGDPAAFATDRGLTLVANDARLTGLGQKVETFRVPAGEVTAYRAAFDQGSFHRVLAFVATPDDKAAYPVTVMLTDDPNAAAMLKAAGLARPGAGAADAHAWFIDLYQCSSHSNITPPAMDRQHEPDYAAVKARVVEALSAKDAFAAGPPERGFCASANWLMPGFGVRRSATAP